ncbi:MAG: hypothetical protein OXI91_13570 [Chloroflexota bacterium]|nr:hypothetical protein [Chloroflexota bacterium]
MARTLLLTALVVILSTAACASMSLEDYAEECGEWVDDYGDIGDIGSLSSFDPDDLEDALEDWNALSPPGEVKAIHDIRYQVVQLILQAAERGQALEDHLDDLRDELDDAPRSQRDEIRDYMDDLEDELEDELEDLRDELDDLSDDYEDAFEDLPRSVERELEAEDCI